MAIPSPVAVPSQPDVWGRLADFAQRAEVYQEQAEQRATRERLEKKDALRRSARYLAQVTLGDRLRAAGVQYTPELDQLEVDCGDGTSWSHYRMALHGLHFGLDGEAVLQVWHAAEPWGRRTYTVVTMVDLGRAVKALGGRL